MSMVVGVILFLTMDPDLDYRILNDSQGKKWRQLN